ncbi:putative ABC transport system ATP-binding protein [Streptomyces zhaozhouensis]|uniref:Putative ABC transport system ATP-binding protein n=1 Tax=Streptomyces zhaozhouensis TaxID=1300267 RepID=A0A286DR88_9ACTN|nr:ABC transporter ATP-binding protein [Streptomyces zhaozhouensis]SOD61064.1 putative ABC transport system ATP-binding protein [Streptomyces zhaozhouensis]
MFRVTDEAAAGAPEALRLVSVSKVYGRGGGDETAVRALDGVTLSLPTGSFTAVMGPSGSGKSTLLQCAAGLDQPSGGLVVVAGAELAGNSEAELTRLRRQRIGFIFQQFNLLPTLTVLQNVLLPSKLAGTKVNRAKAVSVLERLGLGGRLRHLPAQLSGGQQQRVAIARALVTEPEVVFADEPTGALDTRSAREVLGLLTQAVRDYGRTVVMVTHDPVAASYADQVIFLADGRLAGALQRPTAEEVAERMTRLGAWDAEDSPVAAQGVGV